MLGRWTRGTISQGHAGSTWSMSLPDQPPLPPHACRARQYSRKRDQTVPWTWLHNRALVLGVRGRHRQEAMGWGERWRHGLRKRKK